MNPARKLKNRLIEGGWTLHRNSKHAIWKHPNGASFPLVRSVSDSNRTMINFMRQIEKLEKELTIKSEPEMSKSRASEIALKLIHEKQQLYPPTTVIEVPLMADTTKRTALVNDATKILRSTRLTDEEVAKLVEVLKTNALAILTESF